MTNTAQTGKPHAGIRTCGLANGGIAPYPPTTSRLEDATMGLKPRRGSLLCKKLLSVLAAGAVSVASAVMVTGDENAQTTYLQDKTVITVTQTGKLYVTEPGEIELLVVGGGGGGGQGVNSGDWSPGAGGGGGGVIHKETFSVSAGPYDVVIGAGGAVNTGSRPLGGDTTVFGLTAKGGGCGAKGAAFTAGADGASGGGGTKGWSSTMQASKAIYGSYDNLGHDGGEGDSFYTSGGGGGAGTAANGATGGEGYPCSITGTEVYYAGGGKAPAGKGSAADNCYGGGGAGDNAGYAGVVIVSFVRSAKPCSEDFSLSGWNRRYLNENDTAVAFTESGTPLTLTVTGEGSVDVLLVGGGGGGGHKTDADRSGGGGGAGGVVYLKNISVTAGVYTVSVGAGGAIDSNGGDSTALDFMAFGGGHGAVAGNGTNGGCGGGAATYYQGPTYSGGAASHSAEGNIGNKGGSASSYIRPAGGGGAGGAGGDGSTTDHGGAGGIGYECDITGTPMYYAGGGGGYYYGGAAGGLGGGGAGGTAGTDGLGGGGGSNAKGGSGVVILRYAKKSYKESFDDATGGKMSSFTRDGKRYRVHTFASDGQFVLSHPAKVEVLIVGGGGGGGGLAGVTQYARGGGGGGGGVIHKSLILEAKPYDISIGEGGAVNDGARPNGGNTVAFGLTAYGGGCGAKSEGFTLGTDGASGGGGSKGSSGSTQSAQKAIYCDAPYLNFGHDGAEASTIYNSGGGGGAGTAANGTVGGDGYPCSITGTEVYYAGGGGGNGANGEGGGKDCYGGGGKSNEVGGNGVVIVCHEKPRTGLFLVVK